MASISPATVQKSAQAPQASSGGESFAALFEESLNRKEMRVGEVITAEVLSVDENWVVVNAGLKSESIIPVEEFRNDAGGNDVYILRGDNRAVVQPVRLGHLVEEQWLVLDGLKPGDRVVVESTQRFHVVNRLVDAAERGECTRTPLPIDPPRTRILLEEGEERVVAFGAQQGTEARGRAVEESAPLRIRAPVAACLTPRWRTRTTRWRERRW